MAAFCSAFSEGENGRSERTGAFRRNGGVPEIAGLSFSSLTVSFLILLVRVRERAIFETLFVASAFAQLLSDDTILCFSSLFLFSGLLDFIGGSRRLAELQTSKELKDCNGFEGAGLA